MLFFTKLLKTKTMKKLFTIICLLATTLSFSQNESNVIYGKPQEKEKTSFTGYVSYALSMTNSSEFKTTSYTGVEGGFMYDNIGAGLIFGRGSLKGLGSNSDNIGQYFYEVKTSASMPIGKLTGNVIFGYGGYFNSSHNFIEYGAGVTYNYKQIGYGVTCSNWDGVTYVTPSVTYNF
jgi:hypothetical protein